VLARAVRGEKKPRLKKQKRGEERSSKKSRLAYRQELKRRGCETDRD